jgi:hypothetical protein
MITVDKRVGGKRKSGITGTETTCYKGGGGCHC